LPSSELWFVYEVYERKISPEYGLGYTGTVLSYQRPLDTLADILKFLVGPGVALIRSREPHLFSKKHSASDGNERKQPLYVDEC
jgi:hypothetical protein